MLLQYHNSNTYYYNITIATHIVTISHRSFAAAIFHASMCRFALPAHADVKGVFDILAELTRKVGWVTCDGGCVTCDV